MTTYRIPRVNVQLEAIDPAVLHDALRRLPSSLAAELGPRRGATPAAATNDAAGAELATRIARDVARQVRARTTVQG